MKLLIDAHALIWAVDEPSKLSVAAAAALQAPANVRLISAATSWEIAIKCGTGKLMLSLPYLPWITKARRSLKAGVLPIAVKYADRQSRLPFHHRDPFDRMLVAQSLVEAFPIVSNDVQLDAYGITRIW